MPKKPKIDLNDLTLDHFKKAEAVEPGGCRLSDPCIIGTLMPPPTRKRLDATGMTDVEEMVSEDWIDIPGEQYEDAVDLQSTFDSREVSPKAYEITKAYIVEKYKCT